MKLVILYVHAGIILETSDVFDIRIIFCDCFKWKHCSDRMDKEIGKGTFGKVFESYDSKWKDFIAIKVIRSIQKYIDSAQIEAEILDDVYLKQKKHKVDLCVKMYSTFTFNGITIARKYIGHQSKLPIRSLRLVPFVERNCIALKLQGIIV